MSLTTVALANPRDARIWSITLAPLPYVTSAMRSPFASNDDTNDRAASLTAGHLDAIELETSSTSERSTMRRVAWPLLLTTTWLRFASFMNVVGIVTDAVTVTMFTPVAVLVWRSKKFAAAVGSVVVSVAMYPRAKFC